jgi:hypothetical protein
MPDLTNPYRSPDGACEVARTVEVRNERQIRDRAVESTLLWLATTVVAVAGFVVLSTARIFVDYIGIRLSAVLFFLHGRGWFVAVAWVIASGAILTLRCGGWTRTVGIVLLTTYLLGMLMILLQFLADVWSPMWSLA